MARGDIYDAKEIKRLSQDLGLNDRQISEKLGCARATITRLRGRHNIPKCNLKNRMDKSFVCVSCGETIYIARRQRLRAFCDECRNKIK